MATANLTEIEALVVKAEARAAERGGAAARRAAGYRAALEALKAHANLPAVQTILRGGDAESSLRLVAAYLDEEKDGNTERALWNAARP